jgi:hypothetical protein
VLCPTDPLPATYGQEIHVRSATVVPDVKLEVLELGGAGRPPIFREGLSGTAHIFHRFAQKLTTSCRGGSS